MYLQDKTVGVPQPWVVRGKTGIQCTKIAESHGTQNAKGHAMIIPATGFSITLKILTFVRGLIKTEWFHIKVFI